MASTNRGSALLEVLLATSVVTVALGVSFQSLSEITRLESWLHEKSIARALAEGQLHALRASRQLAVAEEQNGTFEPPYGDYSWRFRVVQAFGAPAVSLGTLEVYGKGDESPTYRVATIIPAYMASKD